MLKNAIFRSIVIMGLVLGLGSFIQAQDNYKLSVSYRVIADPGQTEVPVYLVLTTSTQLGGVDIFLQYDRSLMAASAVNWWMRFQYAVCETSLTGKIKMVLRRHRADSTYVTSLPAGTDTLGVIKMTIFTADLLADVETPVHFWENPITPDADNRLIKVDSTFVVPPALTLQEGSVIIRHPLYGDVNDDAYPYTIADVIFFVNYLVGSQNLTPRQRANSDVNQDGVQGSMADFIDLIKKVTED